MATSFHPELTGDRRVHALFVDIVRAPPGRAGRRCRREREGQHAMSGHSKWATTKHKKAGIDAKRGKLFAKLIKNIEVAARTGGGDLVRQPDALRRRPEGEEVLGAQRQHRPRGQARRPAPRPAASTTRASPTRATRAGGVAVLIECLTDNKNRSAMEVRTAMTRNGGSMADPGSVSYLFSRKGVVVVPKADGVDEDAVLMAVLDAGAEEVRDLGDTFEVVSEPGDLVAVRTALQDAGIDYDSAEAGFVPSVQVELDEDTAGKVFRLIDALEDLDDVQNVYANYDVSDEVMEKIDA